MGFRPACNFMYNTQRLRRQLFHGPFGTPRRTTRGQEIACTTDSANEILFRTVPDATGFPSLMLFVHLLQGTLGRLCPLQGPVFSILSRHEAAVAVVRFHLCSRLPACLPPLHHLRRSAG